MLTRFWTSVVTKLKAWWWSVWPKHVAWYSYQTNKDVFDWMILCISYYNTSGWATTKRKKNTAKFFPTCGTFSNTDFPPVIYAKNTPRRKCIHKEILFHLYVCLCIHIPIIILCFQEKLSMLRGSCIRFL